MLLSKRERKERDTKEKPFLKWLLRQGYVESTAQLTVRHLRLAHQYWLDNNRLATGYLDVAQRRFLMFAEETGIVQPYDVDFLKQLNKDFKPLNVSPNGPRKKPELDEGQWLTLLRAIKKSTLPEDRVILFFMLQAYGLKEFLTMPVVELLEEVDVRFVPWARELPKRSTLSTYLCKASDKPLICAQTRMRRRLAAWAKELHYNMDLRSLHKASVIQANRAA